MKQALRSNLLTLSLAGIVLIYHSVSLLNLKEFDFAPKQQVSYIQLRIGEWMSKKWEFPSFGGLNFGESFDPASTWIKQRGYTFKYLIGQVPGFVVVGKPEKHRQFYLREEICSSYPFIRKETAQSGIWLARFVAQMKARGVTVIVVPIPTKVAMARGSLPATLPSCLLWAVVSNHSRDLEEEAYLNYKAIVDGDVRHILDLYKVYEGRLKANPNDYVFVPSDSHWSSLGISLAAKEVIDHLLGLGWSIGSPTLNLASSVQVFGEFIDYLRIPESYARQSEALQWTEPRYSIEVGSKPKRDPSGGRVIVFGTSHSARIQDSQWGFGKLLAKALSRELLDLSFVGAGPIDSFLEFKKAGHKIRREDLLIWEFPMRHTPTERDGAPELDFE